MANRDCPMGLTPYEKVLHVGVHTAGGTIYPGSPVKRDSGGGVVVAAASDALCGVAATYATSGNEVLVYDSPDQLFVVQADNTDVDALTDIGLNYNFVVASADTTYRRANIELDANTGADTATLPLKLLGIVRAVDNAYGGFVRCIVKINNHQMSGGTGTLGV